MDTCTRITVFLPANNKDHTKALMEVKRSLEKRISTRTVTKGYTSSTLDHKRTLFFGSWLGPQGWVPEKVCLLVVDIELLPTDVHAVDDYVEDLHLLIAGAYQRNNSHQNEIWIMAQAVKLYRGS